MVSAGKDPLSAASLSVGNCLPLGSMPEGTIVCQVEEKTGDRGKIAKASGNYATVIAHNRDTKKTRVKLPSGSKKVSLVCSLCPLSQILPLLQTLLSTNRAVVGVVAGGGRIDKPLLKAGAAYHKYKVKRNCWPKVRGVAMNVSSAGGVWVWCGGVHMGVGVCMCEASLDPLPPLSLWNILMEEATISTLASPQLSREEHQLEERLALIDAGQCHVMIM